MAFTLKNIQIICQEEQQKLKTAGYEEIQRRVQKAASWGKCAVMLPCESLGPNRYMLTSEHAQWLKELGFKVKWIEGHSYLYIDWED